jgi:glutamyl-tRNA synthetase
MQGILPRAMVNFLALLGWSPGGDREVMLLDEMIGLFSPEGLQKKAAIFDPRKLEWMNGQHLSLMTPESLAPLVTPVLIGSGLTTAADLGARTEWYFQLLDQLKVRARTVHDIVRQATPYFADEIAYDPDAVAKAWKDPVEVAAILNASHERLSQLDEWSVDAMERALRELAEELGLSGGKVFQPLRVALTGMSVSPGIFEVLLAMGRDRALLRLDQASAHLGRADSIRTG